jgi:hypothetical protein
MVEAAWAGRTRAMVDTSRIRIKADLYKIFMLILPLFEKI